jgi:hypothetical protein
MQVLVRVRLDADLRGNTQVQVVLQVDQAKLVLGMDQTKIARVASLE